MFGSRALAAARACSSVSLSTTHRDFPPTSSLKFMLVLSSTRKTSDDCDVFFSWSVTEARNAASRHRRIASNRSESATHRQRPLEPRSRRR